MDQSTEHVIYWAELPAHSTARRLHPDRSFDTIACGTGDFCSVLAQLEMGERCAVLLPEAGRRLLCRLNGAKPEGGLEVRRTLGFDAAGAVKVEPLRAWLAEPASGVRVVMNGGASPYGCRPLQMGADVVVEEFDAWMDAALLPGHGAAGPYVAVVARSDRAWERFWEACGMEAACVRWELDAAEDALLCAGLRGLSAVCQRRCDAALVAATYLAAHPAVGRVSYPGLAQDAANDAARRTLEHGFGPLVAFECTALSEGGDLLVRQMGCAVGAGAAVSSLEVRGKGACALRVGLENALDVVGWLEEVIGEGVRAAAGEPA